LEHFSTTADRVIVTTLDADNKVDPDYFSVLTFTYLKTPHRKHASYQPVIFFFNNFWQAPFFSKVTSLFNTFWILFNFTKKFGPRNFSSHAQPLDGLIETHFRSTQTIVEDGHQYRRAYFATNGNHECIPVFAKIYQDCNLSTSRRATVKAQYNQMRRWSHGAQDVAYVRCQMIDHRHTCSRSRMVFEFGRLLEGIILRSTLHTVLLSGIAFSFFKDITLSSYLSL
jgi:Glycosyl transferase family group 2